MREVKEFKTDNLSLAPFLQMNGLNYLRAEPSIGKNDKPVIAFVFEDPKGVGRDLELDFFKSDFKVYRDLTFFYRNEIEKMNRRLDKIRQVEKREKDNSYYSGE